MEQHMGYLLNRFFINENINNDHFIDICVTNKNEKLLWYCSKDNSYGMYAVCLDEETQEGFFEQVGANFEDKNFENKLQLFFKDYLPADYGKTMRSFCKEGAMGVIPSHIKFDKESDPHVLMTDRTSMFSYLSENLCEDYLFELIMNSVQEFQLGEATEIKIRVNANTYEIVDNGSGIAVEDSEKFKDYEWKRILVYPHIVFDYPKYFAEDSSTVNRIDYFQSPYKRADFYKKCPKYNYKISSPKATWNPGDSLAHAQCYAKSMRVVTIRNDKEYSFEFKNGYCTSGRKINDIDTFNRGTRIVWEPDKCCFESATISLEALISFIERQALLNAGLKISLDYNGTKYDYHYPNGIKDYISKKIDNLMMPIATRKFTFSTQYDVSITNQEELELCLGIGSNGFLESYHNYRKMEYGSTVYGIYDEITNWFNDFLKNSVFLRDFEKYREINFTTDDIKKHFSIVISCFSEYSSYCNAAYKGLKNSFFEAAVKKAIKGILDNYFGGLTARDKVEEAKKVLDMFIASR